MSFWQFLQANWSELLLRVQEHIVLVFISILVAVLIGVPAGIVLTRYRAWRGPVLGIANVMQTIPSLALFGFLIPLPFIGGIGTRTALVHTSRISRSPLALDTHGYIKLPESRSLSERMASRCSGSPSITSSSHVPHVPSRQS